MRFYPKAKIQFEYHLVTIYLCENMHWTAKNRYSCMYYSCARKLAIFCQ